MQKKSRRSNKFLNKMYMFVGKTIVFTGAFCGLFFLVGNVVSFLEPFVFSATSFCISHVKWLMMGIFILVAMAWGISFLIESRGRSNRHESATVEDVDFID